MTTDRELLELAAKAAGYNLVWGDVYIVDGENIDCTDLPYVRSNQQDEADWYWNPLEDDGGALRLAVKLGIEIHPDREVEEVVTAFCVRNPALIGLNTIEEFNGDEMAATRRAITRAAAQMQLQKEAA